MNLSNSFYTLHNIPVKIHLCKTHYIMNLSKSIYINIHYDVRLELRMNFLVSNALIILDECNKFICLLMWHLYLRNFIKLFIIEVNYFIFILFIFNDHVMENYACFHYVLECFREEKSCRSTYNCESSWSTPHARSTSFLYAS